MEIGCCSRIGAQGAVLMGSKVIESRRTSAALLVGRQTFIEVETPDLEVCSYIEKPNVYFIKFLLDIL